MTAVDLEAKHEALRIEHEALIARCDFLSDENVHLREQTAVHSELIDWAIHALEHDVPLELLAEALPYSGAGEDEAQHVVDHLADAGWMIVPTPVHRRELLEPT